MWLRLINPSKESPFARPPQYGGGKLQYSDTQMSIFRSIHLQHWYPNVNIQIDPFATLVPNYIYGCFYFVPLHDSVTRTDHGNFRKLFQMSIFGSIHLQHWYPNVSIRIDPFATLVPKCQYSDRSICNIGTQITKCQYSDRSICNIGTQMSIFGSDPFAIRLAGAAIRI